MKIAVCQINNVIGSIDENKNKIIDFYRKAEADNADLVIFPELALIGYPPLDLVEKIEFKAKVKLAVKEIASITGTTGLIFGAISEDNDNIGTDLHNSAFFCYDGKVQFIQHKSLIPNYDVFDEVRYFEPAKVVNIVHFKDEILGISICEDIWNDENYWSNRRYINDPVANLIEKDASIIINISASPYSYGKRELRRKMISSLAAKSKISVIYTCCVGAQTELIFDGASMCFNANGELMRMGKVFEEDYFIYDTKQTLETIQVVERSFEEEVLNALILGVKEYCSKLNIKKVILGLSGGIDSAIVAVIASMALGVENVHVVLMPSRYSSKGSIDDSLKLIENLGLTYDKVSIQSVVDEIESMLKPLFKGLPVDLTEENLQARVRGLYLMALSNKFGYLVLTTGNKSEISVGYATLYGDMAGGLAVIGDVYKTEIYKLASHINKDKEIIPFEIIEKAPSAELRPDQKDQDSLPPYDQLDDILKMYLEENREFDEITSLIKDKEVVKKVLRLVDMNEFKRKQAAPILRVSSKAFGYGRRYPIVQGWRK